MTRLRRIRLALALVMFGLFVSGVTAFPLLYELNLISDLLTGGTGVLDPAFRLTQRLFLGDLRRLGLPSHPDGGGTRLLRDGVTFAIDDGFVRALKAGRIEVVAEVNGFDDHGVRLADGTVCVPDVVIAATGYRSGLDPLLGHLGVLDHAGNPTHPMGEPDPSRPGLWFAGYRPIFTGYFDAARIAADRIANAIAADPRTTRSAVPPCGSGLPSPSAAPERAAA